MRIIRILVHSLLLVAILSTGLPLSQPADMNRDGRTDLSDAIISVRELARTAVNGSAFREGVENALVTLSVAAGLKNMISKERDPGMGSPSSALPTFLIASPVQFTVFSTMVYGDLSHEFLYNSPALTPLAPPPRSAVS